jgi:hypothetical protein
VFFQTRDGAWRVLAPGGLVLCLAGIGAAPWSLRF